MDIIEVEDLFSLRWNPGTVVWNVYDRRYKHIVRSGHDPRIPRGMLNVARGVAQEFSGLKEVIQRFVAKTPHGASLRYAYWAHLKGGIGCLLTDKPCMKNGDFSGKLLWQNNNGAWSHPEVPACDYAFRFRSRPIQLHYLRDVLSDCASQRLVGAAPLTNLLQLWFQDGAEGVQP